jgi:hypothetical protein
MNSTLLIEATDVGRAQRVESALRANAPAGAAPCRLKPCSTCARDVFKTASKVYRLFNLLNHAGISNLDEGTRRNALDVRAHEARHLALHFPRYRRP